jgi:hypothetical protein
MPVIHNDAELQTLLMPMMKGILDETALGLSFELRSKIISKVYAKNQPKMYKRHGDAGGLLSAWEVSKSKVSGKFITSDIDYHPENMTGWDGRFSHGSPLSGDIRDALAEIIIEGKSGSYFDWTPGKHWWKYKRDFWKPFLNFLDTRRASKMFEDALRKRGLKFKRI